MEKDQFICPQCNKKSKRVAKEDLKSLLFLNPEISSLSFGSF